MKTIYEEKLDDVILEYLDELSKSSHQDDNEEKVNEVTELIGKSIELKKLKLEKDKFESNIEKETILKEKELETTKKIERNKLIADGLFKGAGTIAFGVGLIFVTAFEKDDSYSFTLGKMLSRDVIKFIRF